MCMKCIFKHDVINVHNYVLAVDVVLIYSFTMYMPSIIIQEFVCSQKFYMYIIAKTTNRTYLHIPFSYRLSK